MVRKAKGIIWTSGQCSVGEVYGSGKRQCVSITEPPRRCCRSQASSTDGLSRGRERFMP